MTWNDITVKQYQQLYKIREQASKEDSTLDILVEMISVCEGLAIDEIDSWPYNKLLTKKAEYQFLDELDFDRTAKSYIETNGKRYHFVHEVEKMPAARYIEAKTFAAGGIVYNLHKIMASCVMPMKKKWFGWVDDKYDARNHSLYAEDILNAKFTDVYNCVVFFCQLYAGWMIHSQDYLVMIYSQTMSENQAKTLVKDLCQLMAGYITPQQLQSLKELN